MTAAQLAAVITAAAGLVAAVTALVQALRAKSAVAAHVQEHAASTTRAARPARAPSDGAK